MQPKSSFFMQIVLESLRCFVLLTPISVFAENMGAAIEAKRRGCISYCVYRMSKQQNPLITYLSTLSANSRTASRYLLDSSLRVFGSAEKQGKMVTIRINPNKTQKLDMFLIVLPPMSTRKYQCYCNKGRTELCMMIIMEFR